MKNEPAGVLVLTSTFPRCKNDRIPSFVLYLCDQYIKKSINVDVLAPHAMGLKTSDNINGINIYRYKYFFQKWEKLAYGGGILENIKQNKFLLFLVPFFLAVQFFAVFDLLKKNKYDVIHAHWLIPQALVAVCIKKILYKKSPEILCTLHGGDLFAFRSKMSKALQKWILRNADCVTVVSEYMRNRCVGMENSIENIHVISMGVDFDNLFKPVTDVKRKRNRLIFVGRLVEKKGVAFLIDALLELRNDIPDVELILVGDGPLRTDLEKKVNDCKLDKNIKFIGSVRQKELPALYSSAMIAITPSIIDSAGDQEGLGLVIAEALGCGCVVIASALRSISDIIKDGENGLLVTPGESLALAGAIKNLLQDEARYKKLSAHGIKSVYDKFNWSSVGKRYTELISDMADK